MKIKNYHLRNFCIASSLILIGSLIPLAPVLASTKDCTINSGANCTETFSYSGAIQNWTIPAGITEITVDVIGASGGLGTSSNNSNGGRGVRMQGVLTVTPGNVLKILVGEKGVNATSNGGGGGGGGSFIVSSADSPLVIAGGGGGGQGQCCSVYVDGVDASTGTSGTVGTNNSGTTQGAGGTSGNGGGAASSLSSGAGGGLLTNGANGSANGGKSFLNGGAGGASTDYSSSWTGGGRGGFGSGGGAHGGAGGGGGGYSGGGAAGGSSNWSGGGGGGSYSIATSQTNTAGFQTGNGIIRITYLNSPVLTTFSSATSSLTNTTSNITYSLIWNQSVTGFTVSDIENAGTASCTFSLSSSSASQYTLTASDCSEGTLIPRVKANSVTGNTTGPPSATNATTTITIDRTTPTITSVTGPSNATYIPGQSLNFTVNFSETVVVTNTPRLVLTIGSTTKFASYLSGSNSTALIFRYTIETQAGLFDTDGITLSLSLDQQNGVIDDLAANRLANTSLTSPNLTSVLVAQVPSSPTIDSINVSNQTLTVNFTPGDSNGSAISNYKYSLNNGSTYTTRSPISTTSPLTITGLTNGITYQVKIRAVNQAGDGAESLTTSAIPLDDQIAPELISFSTNASNGTYIYGESITITATFSEDVRANSEIVITLNSGSSLALTTNSVSSTLNATYQVQDGDFTDNLAITSFTITSVKDVVGNDLQSTTLPATNISTNSTIAIDGIRPTINSSSTSLKNSYSSRVVLYSITFNRAIDLITLNDSLTIPTGWSANISGSADSYVVSLTNASPSNGAVALVIDLSTIEDLVGNTGSGTQTLTLTLNRQTQVTNWIKFLWGEQLQRF
jgi:hypothetical protein